jgi:hypothetical protein
MIAAGLTVITNAGCELSDMLGDQGAGLTFEAGDWSGLGRQVLTLAKDSELCRNTAKSALSYASNEFSFAVTTAPVRAWVREPHLAQDKRVADFQERPRHMEY